MHIKFTMFVKENMLLKNLSKLCDKIPFWTEIWDYEHRRTSY